LAGGSYVELPTDGVAAKVGFVVSYTKSGDE
jgi:hypothetical protein